MNYTKLRSDARKLVKKDGAVCTVTRNGTRVYDATTDSYTDTSITISGYAIQSSYDDSMIDGKVIQSGDVKFVFVPDETSLIEDPKQNDIVNFGNEKYTVIHVQVKKPDGKTVISDIIQGRK
jgi:hypothetical protein